MSYTPALVYSGTLPYPLLQLEYTSAGVYDSEPSCSTVLVYSSTCVLRRPTPALLCHSAAVIGIIKLAEVPRNQSFYTVPSLFWLINKRVSIEQSTKKTAIYISFENSSLHWCIFDLLLCLLIQWTMSCHSIETSLSPPPHIGPNWY